MFILYDLIFLIVTIVYLPIYLFRRKFHHGFLARLGILPKGLSLDRPIWIHAVSVGEVLAIRRLLDELRKIYPDKKFVISTVTATGNKIAQGIAKGSDFLTYLPLDFSFIISAVLDRINPSIFIIAETEIWPNLITHLYRRKIPVITVNGRISDNSFKGYLSIRVFIKPILNKVSLFCVQSSSDQERLKALGVPEAKVSVTGNMKFDNTDYTDSKKDYTDYKKKLYLELQDKLLVAASTHPQEEEIILGAYKKLLSEFGQIKLLIAPRHPERSNAIAKIVSRFGFQPVFVSSLPTESIPRGVFILDSLGQLLPFYSIADIVFVGGSLVKKGGHNILEPAFQGKPILFGPYMFNFRDIVDLFLTNKAAILVNNQEELAINIADLLNNPPKAIALGKRAFNLILENQGATKRNAQYLRKVI